MSHIPIAAKRWMCQFCHLKTADWYTVTAIHASREPQQHEAALCSHHAGILAATGSRGRVHGRTGIRWVLGGQVVGPD